MSKALVLLKTNSKDARRILVSAVLILSCPLYILCSFNHICMDGHMRHPPYSAIDYLIDAGWMFGFAFSFVLAWKSNLHLRRTIMVILILLFVSRFLLADLLIPLILLPFIFAIRNFFGGAKDRTKETLEEQKTHRRAVFRRWKISLAIIIGIVLLVWGAIQTYWVLRRASSPLVKISEMPFSKEYILKPGDTYVFKLPNGKPVAVWCEKWPALVRSSSESDLALKYGEKPFQELEHKKIPTGEAGSYVVGDLISYIRHQSTISSNDWVEYVLYVEKYKIGLKRKGESNDFIPLTVSVEIANEDEQVKSKDKVDYYLKKLKTATSESQIDTLEKLYELLWLEDMYAVPRRSEIIGNIRPLLLSPDSEIRDEALAKLIALGDEQSILQVILPEPKDQWLTAEAAQGLARSSELMGKDRIYQKVLPFLESNKPELFRFAMSFFSQVKYEPARIYMKKALKSEQTEIRLDAFHALFGFEGDHYEMAKLVNTMLDDSDKNILLEALREASRYSDAISPNQICKYLKHPDKEIRHMATFALDGIWDYPGFSEDEFTGEFSVSKLCSALEKDNVVVSGNNISGINDLLWDVDLYNKLAATKGEKPSPELAKLKEGYDQIKVGKEMENLIKEYKLPRDEKYLKKLNRAAIEEYYPQEAPKNAVRTQFAMKSLLDSTYDEEATVREGAATTLGRIAYRPAYPRLIELLKDIDAQVRSSAINGLRWLGDKKAIPEITELEKNDPAEEVRKMARRTIRELSE